jgi:hypothetical protein
MTLGLSLAVGDAESLLAELVKTGEEAAAALFAEFGLDVAPPRARTVRPVVCSCCGGPISVQRTGRPAVHCSSACRVRTWRAARAR